MPKYTSDSSDFGADGPFFRIIREGLEGLADGEDVLSGGLIRYASRREGWPSSSHSIVQLAAASSALWASITRTLDPVGYRQGLGGSQADEPGRDGWTRGIR